MKLIIALWCLLGADAALLKTSPLDKRQFPGVPSFFADTNSPIFLYPAQQIAKKTPLKPVLSQSPKAEKFTQASRKRLVFGPFQLQPVAGNHKTGEGGFKLDRHSDLFEETLGDICRNCMILNLHYDVTDKTGKKLLPRDEIYTHHMVLGSSASSKPMTPVKVNRTCAVGFGPPGGIPGGFPNAPPKGPPKGPPNTSPKVPPSAPPKGLPSGPPKGPPKGASPPPGGPPGFPGFPDFSKLGDFFTSPPVIIINKGQEKNAINFGPLDQNQLQSGFWIGSNDTIMTSVEIVNYKPAAQDVYLTLDLEYLSFDKRPESYLRTEFASLIAMSCSSFGIRPPSDRLVTYETPVYDIQKNLYLVNLNPHLHDGAMNMKVHINGKEVCSANAVYGNEGGMSLSGQEWETISHYTPCKTIKLNRGDQLRITSDYDLRQHKLRPDSADHEMGSESMAMSFIQFASAE